MIVANPVVFHENSRPKDFPIFLGKIFHPHDLTFDILISDSRHFFWLAEICEIPPGKRRTFLNSNLHPIETISEFTPESGWFGILLGCPRKF